MDPILEGPSLNPSLPVKIARKRKNDRISNPNFEAAPNSRRNFGDEPQITAAILSPPPLIINSTRKNPTILNENRENVQQIESIKLTVTQPSNITSLNKNETIGQLTKVSSTIQPTLIKPSKTTTIEPEVKGGDLGDVVSSVWKRMKQIIGFSPPCHNGGHKTLQGICECSKYFEGELCEQIICTNNGTKTRVKTIPQQDVCKCPHPQFISGNHCEYVHCANGGKDLGNGTCRCIDNWYTGQFCEFYASSWLAVVGLPLICLAIIVLCCVVCRLDLFPRRSYRRGDRDRRRSYGNYQMPSRRTYANNPHRFHQPQQILSHGITEQARMMQENLLNDAAFRRNTRSRSNDDQTVYRLETIPTYNPEILNNSSEDYKLDVPPPTYEQAITRCPTIVPPNFGNSALPDYSPPRMSTSNSQRQHENG